MRKAFLLLIFILSNAQIDAVQYTATILHRGSDVGSIAYGISGGLQIGVSIRSTAHSSAAPFAAVWQGTAGSMTDFGEGSQAYAIDGRRVVGYKGSKAALWTDASSSSYVNLHPNGWASSQASAIQGDSIGGYGYLLSSSPSHALLWKGSDYSVVDLHPSGFYSSKVNGVYGNNQVGRVLVENNMTTRRAVIWQGSTDSMVMLHPAGSKYWWSEATAITASYQAGRITSTSSGHAAIWHGTAESMIDINPSGFANSLIQAATGSYQIGCAYNTSRHAFIWRGTAASAIDLHQFLPPGYTDSYAMGVDAYGNVVGYAFAQGNSSYGRAVLWNITPEPATFMFLGLGTLFIRRKLR